MKKRMGLVLEERIEELLGLRGSRKGRAVTFGDMDEANEPLRVRVAEASTAITNFIPATPPPSHTTWAEALANAAAVVDTFDAETDALDTRITNAVNDLDDLANTLANQYATNTEIAQAIDGEITAFETALDANDGLVGSLRANLQQNYLTSTDINTAISGATTALRSEIVGGNLVRNTGLVNADGWTGGVLSVGDRPSGETGNSLLLNTAASEGPVRPFNPNGKSYRLIAWARIPTDMTVQLRGKPIASSDTDALLSTGGFVAGNGDVWTQIDVTVDGNVDAENMRFVFVSSDNTSFRLFDPSITARGTINDISAQFEQTALTLADGNGALAVFQNQLEASFDGIAAGASPIYNKALAGPASIAVVSGITAASQAPGPFGQANAVRLTHVSGAGTGYLDIPSSQSTALAGQSLRVDVLARKGTANNFTMLFRDQTDTLTSAVIAPANDWTWHTIVLPAVTAAGTTGLRVSLRPDSAQGQGYTDFARVIVRPVTSEFELPQLANLTASVDDILALTVDNNSALGQFTTGTTASIGALNATVTTQGSALADVEGEVNAMYLIEVATGTGSAARFQITAPGGGATVAKLQAEFIDLVGHVRAEHMTAKSITAANGAIDDLAVDTLQIDGQAITIAEEGYSPGVLALSSSYTVCGTQVLPNREVGFETELSYELAISCFPGFTAVATYQLDWFIQRQSDSIDIGVGSLSLYNRASSTSHIRPVLAPLVGIDTDTSGGSETYRLYIRLVKIASDTVSWQFNGARHFAQQKKR